MALTLLVILLVFVAAAGWGAVFAPPAQATAAFVAAATAFMVAVLVTCLGAACGALKGG